MGGQHGPAKLLIGAMLLHRQALCSDDYLLPIQSHLEDESCFVPCLEFCSILMPPDKVTPQDWRPPFQTAGKLSKPGR